MQKRIVIAISDKKCKTYKISRHNARKHNAGKHALCRKALCKRARWNDALCETDYARSMIEMSTARCINRAYMNWVRITKDPIHACLLVRGIQCTYLGSSRDPHSFSTF